MKENALYFSVLHINGKKIISSTPNNPFIFNCNFDNEKIAIVPQKRIGNKPIIVYYNEIREVDVYACSRLAGPIPFIPSLQYNFDIVVYTIEHESFHIEIPATSEFKKVIAILNEYGVKTEDKLNIFNLFDNKDNFSKTYYAYMEEKFNDFANKYNLDNPRTNYTLNNK